jgi:hypothetical protein
VTSTTDHSPIFQARLNSTGSLILAEVFRVSSSKNNLPWGKLLALPQVKVCSSACAAETPIAIVRGGI